MKITLKAARVNVGLTQAEVAQHIHKGKQTIGAWENGRSSIDVANFVALCQLYKVDEDNIFLPQESNLKCEPQRKICEKQATLHSERR